jgi:hypothetical protein
MSDIINQLLGLKLPVWSTILIVLTAIVLTSPVVTKIIEIRSLNPKKAKKKNLLAHPIFDYLNYSIFFRIKSLDFGDTLKNGIFQDMLIVMLTKYKEGIREFVETGQFDGNSFDFKTKTTTLLHDVCMTFTREWYNLDIPKSNFVFESYKRLSDKSYNITYTNILRIYGSEIYDSDYERMDAILTILNCYFENIIIDAEATIRQINGQLKGETYKPKYL